MLHVANRRAETLGLLDRKRLELARVLATDPGRRAARRDRRRTDRRGDGQLVETIREMRRRGMAIVWIEHIVHVLLQVVERLVCMDSGRIIADGDPRGGDDGRRGDRRLSRERRDVSLLTLERLDVRHGLLAGRARGLVRD